MLCAELVDDPDYPPVGGVPSPKGLAPFSEAGNRKGLASPKGTAPFCVNGTVIRRAA